MGFDASFMGQPSWASTELLNSRMSFSKAQSSGPQVPKNFRGLESKLAAYYVILWIKLDTRVPCKFPKSIWNLVNSPTQSKDKFDSSLIVPLFGPMISRRSPALQRTRDHKSSFKIFLIKLILRVRWKYLRVLVCAVQGLLWEPLWIMNEPQATTKHDLWP